MPGVADAIRRTQLKQEQRARKEDMKELLTMVEEGRLHEADERQLELLKLALDLNHVLERDKDRPIVVRQDNQPVIEAVRAAVTEALSKLPRGTSLESSVIPGRPEMGYKSLVDIKHEDSDLDVSHTESLTEEHDSEDEASGKLETLKRLKGNK